MNTFGKSLFNKIRLQNDSRVSPLQRVAFALLCLAFLCTAQATAAFAQDTYQSPLPKPTGYVNDYANVIDDASEQRMETILKNLDERAQIEFAIVTVQTTGERDIFDYSLGVMRGWGVGSTTKGGLVFIVATNDRKSLMQVNRRLEGDLPDSATGALLRRSRPQFSAGDYNTGISQVVESTVATLADKRGFTIEGIDQRNAYREQPRSTGNRGGGFSACTIALIILVIIIFVLASSRGGGGSGCLNLLLLNSLLNSGGGGSGWSSGGDSSWGGGSDGGFGGFSGGGGDAAGGGAGDSW